MKLPTVSTALCLNRDSPKAGLGVRMQDAVKKELPGKARVTRARKRAASSGFAELCAVFEDEPLIDVDREQLSRGATRLTSVSASCCSSLPSQRGERSPTPTAGRRRRCHYATAPARLCSDDPGAAEDFPGEAGQETTKPIRATRRSWWEFLCQDGAKNRAALSSSRRSSPGRAETLNGVQSRIDEALLDSLLAPRRRHLRTSHSERPHR